MDFWEVTGFTGSLMGL